MASVRSLAVSALLAVLCLLLAACPVAVAQSTLPPQCSNIVGSGNLTQYPDTVELGADNLILAIGYFRAPLLTVYANYAFTFTVPDQSGYTTPNQLKFAVYTNNTNSTNPPRLVTQSQTVTVQSGVRGPQSFVVSLQGAAGILIPGRAYLIAVYNQYNTAYYFNTNARQGEFGQQFVDASVSFPATLPPDFQYDNYLFPVAYIGCQCNTLLGDANLADFPNTVELGSDNLILAIGTFRAPLLTLATSYEFTFSVPDQSGYVTPNQLKFAVYTNASSPELVTESPVVTIASGVSGPQNFIVKLAYNVSEILYPGRQYLLAVYNQYNTAYYFNTNARQGELGEQFVDASSGFPATLPVGFQYDNYLFPLAYKACYIPL